jgi:hypothetical protein
MTAANQRVDNFFVIDHFLKAQTEPPSAGTDERLHVGGVN